MTTPTSGITAWVVDEKAITSMIMWWEPLQRLSQPSHGEISSSGPFPPDVWDNDMLTPITGASLPLGTCGTSLYLSLTARSGDVDGGSFLMSSAARLPSSATSLYSGKLHGKVALLKFNRKKRGR